MAEPFLTAPVAEESSPDPDLGESVAKPKRRPLWVWLLALLGLLGLVAIIGPRVGLLPSPGREASSNLDAVTQPVETAELTVRVSGRGSVVAVTTVNLSPKTAGRLEALYVDQGAVVAAGQVLARMEVGTLEAELAQRRAQLAQAEAEYDRTVAGNRPEAIRRAESQVASAQAQVALATSQRDRFRDLAAQGAISQNELDQYETEARNAAASLNEAQQQLAETASGSRPEEIAAAAAAVAAAKAQVDIVQTQLGEATIRAPFDGVVTQTYATVGAIVTPTTSASATASATSSSILALSAGLEVEVEVAEASIGQVAVGQTVEIVADAFPQETFQGRVKRIAPEALVENNVTVFQVTVELQTGQNRLRSGMTVAATFVGETVAAALLVPTVAIATENGQLGVRVADAAGKPVFRPVTVGLTQGGKTQILTGVEGGDRVFLDMPMEEGGGSPFSPPSPPPG
ncbi:efflux RND transporter periplasmic adaptor subunit [Nodosilinea sp. LEGE 06152]|uniref:efflux RND transporter periplasmic adaptor subunit n=1 Tax=Nodosilinea sp. LEGE 06152 TaxID=2777966 RepID=UPI00187F75AC|nr:efflux RND transporter periplasmic adaptor subunit [Nodosilinea sp. LEGE 06152]MBE9157088.1 efflux RND transporter periplasmic adaptor subunit [Nodosilinea sp. LEGE 06152]